MHRQPKAMLFDLDGTLVDSAPDLLYTLNVLRQDHQLPPMPLHELLPIISDGSRVMVKKALGLDETDPRFADLREQLFKLYEQHLANQSTLFPAISALITYCEAQQLPWGIVTNKLTRHTLPLLEKLPLPHQPHCVVCGDTLTTYKPHPEPILHACRLLNIAPTHSWFVGDSLADMQASQAAGTYSVLALYGYIAPDADVSAWQADTYIQTPQALLTLLQSVLESPQHAL